MPAPHQSTPGADGAAAPVDLRTSIYQMLIGKGLQPYQALGVLYSMGGEGGVNFNANSVGDSGKSIGWGQWNGTRRTNLENTAKSMGTTWNDPSAQLAHFNNEISGPYAAEIERVKQAKTAADATRIWTGSTGEGAGYERPAVNNWVQRVGQGANAFSLDANNNLVFKPGTPPAPATPGAPGATTPAAPATSGAQDFADAAKKGDVGGALAALTKGDEKGKSPLGDLAGDLSPKAPAPQSQMLPTGGGGDAAQAGQAQAGQALLGQVLEQSARPLTWSSRPYGAGMAGPQVPGTTLNSMG
jgi:hypothetical protein